VSARADNQPEAFALRHVLTWAPDGPLEGPGVQSVAWAAGLEKAQLLRTIEQLIESYQGERYQSDAKNEPRCRQLLLVPGTDAYALTVFTPLGEAPDGREGNVWAETLVVPGSWLAQGDWDAAAAFEALTWWGPEGRQGLRQDLEPEPLPPLVAGPLDRLAPLVDAVPQNHLWPLLLAIVQQSKGLRPVRLLEADRDRAGELEEVVMLLPLAVPPSCRLYKVAGQARCLSFRTRSPARGMTPPADITGFPLDAADQLHPEDGVIVDLAGRMLPSEIHDTFGSAYAKSLQGLLYERAWDEIGRLYESARSMPVTNFFLTFKKLLGDFRGTAPVVPKAPERSPEAAETPRGMVQDDYPLLAAAVPGENAAMAGAQASPAEVIPPTAGPPAVAAQAVAAPAGTLGGEPLSGSTVRRTREAWEERRTMEGEAWGLIESYREQLGNLVQSLRQDFQKDLKRAGADLRLQLADLREGQKKELDAFQREVNEIKEVGKRSRQRSASLGKEAEGRTAARPNDHGGRLKELEERLKKLEGGRAKKLERGRAAAGAAAAQLDAEEAPSETARRSGNDGPPIDESPEGFWERLLEYRKLAVPLGIVLLVVLVAGDRVLSGGRRQQAPPPLTSGQEAALLERVGHDAVAAAALAFAALQENIRQEIVALALTHGIAIDETTNCALLQAALRRQAQAGQPGITVDGACGGKTTGALVAATMNPCCRDFQTANDPQAVQQLQNCFLADRLQLGRKSACTGRSPWRAGRTWTANEAAAALALFREAAAAVNQSAKPDLARALRDLDPRESPRLREGLAGKRLTPEQARRVLELTWAARSRREQLRALEKLSDAEIRELARLVNSVAPAPRGASATTTSPGSAPQ
jgi:hypothetical protein